MVSHWWPFEGKPWFGSTLFVEKPIGSQRPSKKTCLSLATLVFQAERLQVKWTSWRWGSRLCCRSYSAEIFNDTHTWNVIKCHTLQQRGQSGTGVLIIWYQPYRLAVEACWRWMLPSLFVASETHPVPVPESPTFSTSPLKSLAYWRAKDTAVSCMLLSYVLCWGPQIFTRCQQRDRFHKSLPWFDMTLYTHLLYVHLRNSFVWNDIRTVCADMSMYRCTCTCLYLSEGLSILRSCLSIIWTRNRSLLRYYLWVSALLVH